MNDQEIVFANECPKCQRTKIDHTPFIDGDIVWVTYVCPDCQYQFREKIDLSI